MFADATPACRVGDARHTSGLDLYGHILLWPPNAAHGQPVHADRSGCRFVGGTRQIGLHAPHPLVASGTRSVLVVWTSFAIHIYGHPIMRTDCPGTRPSRGAELLGGPPTLECTHHTRLSRRGRAQFSWFGFLWPHTSMAYRFLAHAASARGPVGMRNCWGDPRHWIAPTIPACRFGDARRTRGLDSYGHILLWPPNAAHGPPVHTPRSRCRIVGGAPEICLQTPHPLVASGTHAVLVVCTFTATYFYGHPIPRTDRHGTRPGRDTELLGGPPTLVCTHHNRWSRWRSAPYPWFALLRPHTSMATQFRARTANARGTVGMRNCWG